MNGKEHLDHLYVEERINKVCHIIPVHERMTISKKKVRKYYHEFSLHQKCFMNFFASILKFRQIVPVDAIKGRFQQHFKCNFLRAQISKAQKRLTA